MLTKQFRNTTIARLMDYNNQLKDVIKYVISNRSFVLSPIVLEPIFQLKPYTRSIINELFERCVNTGYISEFASLFITNTADSVPEILLPAAGIPIDLKNEPLASPLSSYYELNNKLLVDITSLIKMNKQTRNLAVSDINELHSMYVRLMLVRSFSVSNGWLTPFLSLFIIKAYCLSLASLIGKQENLNFMERITIAKIFALYMSQQFARNDEDPARPNNYYRCTFLGTNNELTDMMNLAAAKAPQGLNLMTCCELIAETGPQRLKNFTIENFYRLAVRLGAATEPSVTRIALEYPPYFTFMLLKVLSGEKGGSLQIQLKENRLIGTESKKFTDELKVCQSLFNNK